MKSYWTQGLVRWHGPLQSRMKVLWVIWSVALGLFCLWLIALVVDFPFRPGMHFLLGASTVVGALCILYGIKYCEFLEPRFLKGAVSGKRPVATVETAFKDGVHPL